MKIKITRTNLVPLRKKRQLKTIDTRRCIGGGFSDDMKMFTLSFLIDEEQMQDIGILFEKHSAPQLFVSDPYTQNNAEIEVEDEPERQ